MENKKLTRKQAIIRRRIFILLCVVILALAAVLIGFIVSAVLKGGDSDKDNASSVLSSSAESSTVESSNTDSSSKENSSSDDTVSVDSTMQSIYDEYNLDPEYTNLLLVNGENPLPQDFDYEGNLSIIEDKYLCGSRNRMNSDVLPYITAMVEQAWEDGVELYILSPYRSYGTQQTLFENEVQKWIKTGMDRTSAENKAATVVARPGTSEHHTGLAADFNSVEDSFEQTEMFAWLKENAEDYGFIMRYSAEKQSIMGVIHESWHWRFVGINAAKEINASGMCLEEYVEYISE